MTLTRWLVAVVGLLGGLLALYFGLAARTDTYLGRWVAWKWSDIDDYQKFPALPIAKPPTAQPLPTAPAPPFAPITYTYRGRPRTRDFEDLLRSTGTTAFIVLRDGAVIYEGYFNGYTRESVNTSFSIAKSVTSLLVGMALDEGYLNSLHDPVTRYLPELLAVDEAYAGLTLEHLLAMKSGIAWRDTDAPWGDKARVYYDPRLRALALSRPLAGTPGESFQYNSYNPVLLGLVLERATGLSPAAYFESRLWQPLGAEFAASWSVASAADGLPKMESGLNAPALDLARLALLVANGGRWNGAVLVSPGWIAASTRIDPASRVPEFGEDVYYQYGWWLYAPGGTTAQVISASGHLGQYFYILPDAGLVVVRFGRRQGEVDSWRAVSLALAAQLAEAR